MQPSRILIVVSLIALFSADVSHAQDPKAAATLQISQTAESYVLSVPVSQIVMTIPKSGLTPKKVEVGGATAHPRYFYFEDKSGLVISGWFEPDRGFKGVEKFWENETRAWKQKGISDPKDVSFLKIDKWDATIYEMALPSPKATNSHIRAHWVQAGTWIDMHLSITSELSSAENRAKLTALLKTIRVQVKEAQ